MWKVKAVAFPHLSLDERQRADGFLQSFDLGGRAGDQRRPGVHDGLTAAFTQTQLAADRHPGTQQKIKNRTLLSPSE